MSSLLQAPVADHVDHPPPAQPSFALRLLRDLRFAAVVGAGAALIITLVVGRPETLYEQLLYSCFISVTGFAIVDTARLLLWPGPARPRAQWAALVALAALTAPVVHFSAVRLVGPLFLHPTPSLLEYPTLPRLSMVVLTFMVLVAGTWVIEHREGLQRARLAQHAAQLRAETIERQALQAQLRLLQAQIEPHMLFNTLANLQGLIAIDPERANAMLDQLIQYLRATLGVSRAESTTLGEEFAAMEAYLGLMGVRMGERLRYRLDLPPELAKLRLPPMLLQPLVENAIVHGLEPKIEGGEILLGARAHGGLLDITVLDTGLGPGHSPVKGSGVGVATTRERLRVLYGERASILLAPAQPQGTLVRLTLPLETA